MRVVLVPAQAAERLRRELHARGLVDRTVKMAKRGEEVLIPLLEAPPFDLRPFGARLDEASNLAPRAAPKNPHGLLRDRLEAEGIPYSLAPTTWERIGDVLLLRFPSGADAQRRQIARIYGEALRCRTVAEDVSGIHGVFRTPKIHVLWGDGTETVHVEGGVRYRLDVARVMFSSGNLPERLRAPTLVRPGEVVVDLFAGIGYFSLPIALRARPSRVYACELNPVAFAYLVENARLNRAEALVPLLGDCRATAPRGTADVVVMGHFSARDYLDVAFRALRGSGLLVYHELCPRERFPADPIQHLAEGARGAWYDIEAVESRIVKSYAPGIVHAVLEARVQRRPRDPHGTAGAGT